MEDFPAWVREGLRAEGWVVVESLETFDVYSGDRYTDRATALRKAIAGDALLASSGDAALSRDVEGEFFLGRLWRSARPLPGDERVTLVYSLDSVERHVKITRDVSPGSAPRSEPSESRPWTCPACNQTWPLLAEEPEVPEEAARCPDCGEPPSGFSSGQVVRVQQGAVSRLGVVGEPVQALVAEDGAAAEEGPYTGEFMVWHLSEGYGSSAPVSPEFEREVFATLPLEPERRRALAGHLMTGISAVPEQIRALDPDEERALFGSPRAE